MRILLSLALSAQLCVSTVVGAEQLADASAQLDPPNIIFILMDDMGYADVGCFGSEKNRTPVIDRLAEEGIKFTSFNTHPVCGPTRAAILTGCYTMRVAESGNIKRHHPLVHANEILIPAVLKPAGYTSACIGKWDLNRRGGKNALKPKDFGFDYSYGRPAGTKGLMYENDQKIEQIPDKLQTRLLTDASLKFIEAQQDGPFFLYLSFAMPHEPLVASEQFRGKSKNGLYGDVIEELDWNIGRVCDQVKALGLDENTIIIVTSDNGPWPYWTGPADSGEAGPLRGQKTETWEGGVRTPFVVRAPGIVPAGTVCDGMIGDIDMLPTFAAFAGVEVPQDRIIDGKNLKPLMTGQVKESPVTTRYFYYDSHLQAVRHGKWKLILTRPSTPEWLHDKGLKAKHRGRDVEAIPTPQLYNLEDDISESIDLAKQHPEVVDELLRIADHARKDLGDYNRAGLGARFYDQGPKRPEAVKWIVR